MNPDNSSPGGDLPEPARRDPAGDPARDQSLARQESAANVIRSQIDSLYGDRSVATPARPETTSAPRTAPATTAVTDDPNPYDRTHAAHSVPQADQWKEYHSAWQNYYQKYYENYYTQQAATATPPAATPTEHYFSHQPTDEQETAEELSNDQALFELRQKLLGRVQESAHKIRRSRHFIPITAAILVVLVFAFLQYNQLLVGTVMAYVSPGNVDPQNIVIDPSTDAQVGPDPRLVIPKINVDVPVLYDVGSDYDSQMAAMQKGVAQFAIPGANSHPGEVGNTAIAGHSSNDLFDQGDYKFIFAQLEKLVPGDSIYANYHSIRYSYVVTKLQVVGPNDASALVYPTNKPILTLITCTPLGTSQNRLLVVAEQTSPDPSAAAPAPAGSGQATGQTDIPGTTPTFLEKLFGAK
jgi:sortase A